MSRIPYGAITERCFDAIIDWSIELGLIITGSPHSQLRQRAALRRLDSRLRADVGVSRNEALRGRRDPVR